MIVHTCSNEPTDESDINALTLAFSVAVFRLDKKWSQRVEREGEKKEKRTVAVMVHSTTKFVIY